MTVSTGAIIDFQRDQILQLAFQLAGLVGGGKTPTADDTGVAANFMRLELMALQAEKVILQTIERTTLALVAGTASYTLPSDTIDIQPGPNDQAGTILRQDPDHNLPDSAETLVSLMSRAEYMDVADKSSSVTGQPTRVYIEKQATVTAVFWPVPDAVLVFRYARVRLLKDTDSGSVTIDLARKWHKYLTFAVAAQIARAKSLPLDRVMSLTKEAERLKDICKADDNQRGKLRFRLAHRGRHW